MTMENVPPKKSTSTPVVVGAALLSLFLSTVATTSILGAALVWVVPRELIDIDVVTLTALIALSFALATAVLRFLRIPRKAAITLVTLIALSVSLGIGKPSILDLPTYVTLQLVGFCGLTALALAVTASFCFNRSLEVLLGCAPGEAHCHQKHQ